MSDEFDDFDEFENSDEEAHLGEHETNLIRQDLVDLANFETTFRAEGYRGVSVFCRDCVEEHYYPWDMLRENLTTLLETGDTPVHEPAFQPNPEEYIPWEYARGYVDALQDVGVNERLRLDACPRCGFALEELAGASNFCPRCGTALLESRLAAAMEAAGLDPETIQSILRQGGLPG